MSKIPAKFQDVTSRQFINWRTALEENPTLNETRQFIAMMGITTDEYIIKYGNKFYPDHFTSVMNTAGAEFAKWKGVEIAIFGTTVKLTKNEDNLKRTLGAVGAIQDLHRSVVEKTTGSQALATKINELIGVEVEDMTTEQIEFVTWLDSQVMKEYMLVIIDMLAWYVVGKVGVAITEANFNVAKERIENMSASSIIPVVDFFFTKMGHPRTYTGVPHVWLLLEISNNCLVESIQFMSTPTT